jgi:aminomethyltransferase
VDEQEYLMSIGGATREPSWLSAAVAAHPKVEVRETDVTNLNLKGPGRFAVIQRLVAPEDATRVAALRPFEGTAVRTAAGLPAHVLRTVIGMELWARPEAMREVWRDILARPESVTPCGWDMVNTYRLECKAFVFALCPLDLHSGTTLWEVGAERAGTPAKDRDFLGRAALAAARNRRRLWLAGLVGAASGTDVPPVGTDVWRDDGAFAGYVTSAVHSPRHRRTLAFAHLKPTCAEKDDVTVDGTRWRVVRPPFTNPQLWS